MSCVRQLFSLLKNVSCLMSCHEVPCFLPFECPPPFKYPIIIDKEKKEKSTKHLLSDFAHANLKKVSGTFFIYILSVKCSNYVCITEWIFRVCFRYVKYSQLQPLMLHIDLPDLGCVCVPILHCTLPASV